MCKPFKAHAPSPFITRTVPWKLLFFSPQSAAKDAKPIINRDDELEEHLAPKQDKMVTFPLMGANQNTAKNTHGDGRVLFLIYFFLRISCVKPAALFNQT